MGVTGATVCGRLVVGYVHAGRIQPLNVRAELGAPLHVNRRVHAQAYAYTRDTHHATHTTRHTPRDKHTHVDGVEYRDMRAYKRKHVRVHARHAFNV